MQTVDELLAANASAAPHLQNVDDFLSSTPKTSGKMTVDQFLQAKNNPTAPITQAFGNVNPDVEVMSGGVNNGVDYGFKYGDPVKAPLGTWVVADSYSGDTAHGYIGNNSNSGYGNSVVLKNPQTGEEIRLSHLASNFAKPGAIVHGGSLVGLVGDTGNATAPHLDAEYKDASGNYADISKTPYGY